MALSTPTRRVVALTSVASFALLGAAVPQAAATPQARISPSQCSAEAASGGEPSGYVISDPATNTSCTTNANGTWLWVGRQVIREGQWTPLQSQVVGTCGRGDQRAFATVYYIRGKLRIKKRVPIRACGIVKTSQRLNRKGTWTIVMIYRSNRLSAGVTVV